MAAASGRADWVCDVSVLRRGGNGPHNGPRNSSLGMSNLRMDGTPPHPSALAQILVCRALRASVGAGFAGLSGSGTITTRPLLCTGPVLRVTADFPHGAGSIVVSVLGQESAPITRNSTDAAVVFKGGKALPQGKNVTLSIKMESALLYTVGFGAK